ncbi:calcium-activated potassium channel subunit beta-2 [Nematolebias whitei]|uniref:calcium-activated potassium channel subunit beta-2 n=1 Tax=Nematolebias whitei TaxID=451745 RepID=UPI0018990D23|nr:calcium-activated potassium channel subunit beta-2 [Nematolebias whitei]
MFFLAGAKKTSGLGRENDKRLIYQKFREVDLLDKKQTVTALKPGEDRAILLGLGMIMASFMLYFVLGITILRSYIDSNTECVYVPWCQKDSAAMHSVVMNISERLKVNQQVPCFYDPTEHQETVLLTRLYDHSVIFHSLLWPSCMLMGGVLIIVMVKLTQYLSRLCEEIGKIKR